MTEHSLGPTRGPVHDGEEMSETSGTRKRANQVQVNVNELSSRNRNMRNKEVNMLLNLTPLTVQTTSGPVGDILGEARPDKCSQN